MDFESSYTPYLSEEKLKYLRLLAEKYPSIPAVCREIINLKAILNLPKGTEHFMSDLHGEYEAFYHILNNAAGVIKEKVDMIFGSRLSAQERQEICTLVYYPVEKIKLLKEQNAITPYWYKMTLKNLTELAKLLSSKYTRSKVRKALPPEFSYIIDELLHAQSDEDNNQYVYHEKIIDTIIDIGSADAFIEAYTKLIKRLAVDHLHIVGDIFDRGSNADRIIELLMKYHSLDIEWGNHDILWMGAACGSEACIANVLRNNIKYGNMEILENSYGISLRSLILFAEKLYPDLTPMKAALKAISIILFKLEGQIIMRHSEYNMDDRLLLDKMDLGKGTVCIEGQEYDLNDTYFPTIDFKQPYVLSEEEQKVMEDLRASFRNSHVLRNHVEFLYEKGSIYRVYNGNLLFHGSIPLNEDGTFREVQIYGKSYKGKALYDALEAYVRRAFYAVGKEEQKKGKDIMWYIWAAPDSPLFGKSKMSTFERYYIEDPATHVEKKNAYYRLWENEEVVDNMLREFGLDPAEGHIINGHVPVHQSEGESPVKCNGKVIVIDGGFCKAYRKVTGIAGYTLIYNSYGLTLSAHEPFTSKTDAVAKETDIVSNRVAVRYMARRQLVGDTDTGHALKERIQELMQLLDAYRKGIIKEKK